MSDANENRYDPSLHLDAEDEAELLDTLTSPIYMRGVSSIGYGKETSTQFLLNWAIRELFNPRITPELQLKIAAHMGDPAVGFSPQLKVQSTGVDCLGRPFSQPALPVHFQIDAVGYGKAYFSRRK